MWGSTTKLTLSHWEKPRFGTIAVGRAENGTTAFWVWNGGLNKQYAIGNNLVRKPRWKTEAVTMSDIYRVSDRASSSEWLGDWLAERVAVTESDKEWRLSSEWVIGRVAVSDWVISWLRVLQWLREWQRVKVIEWLSDRASSIEWLSGWLAVRVALRVTKSNSHRVSDWLAGWPSEWKGLRDDSEWVITMSDWVTVGMCMDPRQLIFVVSKFRSLESSNTMKIFQNIFN